MNPTRKGVSVSSRFLNSRLAAVSALLVVLTVTAAAVAATGAPSEVKSRKTSIGTILVDGKGKTLYLFEKDKGGKSSCYGSCAANWPPYLTTGKPKAGAGATAAKLGTTKRTNGTVQVTYNKHPLYWFKLDNAAGSTKGQDVHAFGGNWHAVTPKGTPLASAAPSGGGYGGGGGYGTTGPTGSGGGGGYTP
jgi:predicted lipoprotein with Yx(FWY)xxD motif